MQRGAEFRRIVVLANSIKRGQRCVAGRDVGTGRELVTGAWIRPISGESEGELERRHMKVAEGGLPEVLDIMDVPLLDRAKTPVHPEDWIVDTGRPWKRVAQLIPETIGAFEERPKNLWLEPKSHPDRVTGAFALRQARHQSLYLIRPEDLRFELFWKHNEYKKREEKKTRAKFSYGGLMYDMSLTDPEFTDRHCPKHPAVGTNALLVDSPYDECLLCVSLTPEFNGYHYKVVATVLELK